MGQHISAEQGADPEAEMHVCHETAEDQRNSLITPMSDGNCPNAVGKSICTFQMVEESLS